MKQRGWNAATVCAILTAIYGCATSGPAVDEVASAGNGPCYICHLDFSGELLVEMHEDSGVGCATCHGASKAHMSDEDHRTPPDKMFDRADVAKACRTCHDVHSDDMVADLIAGGEKVCTDCHGSHRIEGREADPLWN